MPQLRAIRYDYRKVHTVFSMVNKMGSKFDNFGLASSYPRK